MKEGHIKPGKHFCDGCVKDYTKCLSTTTCDHDKMTYKRDGVAKVFETCSSCHDNIVAGINCTHSSTESLTNLTPASYNFR